MIKHVVRYWKCTCERVGPDIDDKQMSDDVRVARRSAARHPHWRICV